MSANFPPLVPGLLPESAPEPRWAAWLTQIARSLNKTITGHLATRSQRIQNVVDDYGADPTGGADAAPAFRAAMNNTNIDTLIIPAGTYLFASTDAAPHAQYDPAGVKVSRDNLKVIAYGAKFKMSDAHSLSSTFAFDAMRNFHWFGGEFIGNRSGLITTDENTAFALSNLRRFSIRDVYLSGNWGGSGSISYGDWLRDGLLDNIKAAAVGIGFDYAFLNNVVISNCTCVGADNNGNQGAGQNGNKGFSVLYNTLTNSIVNTSIVGTYSDTYGVTIQGCDFSNFNTGWAISSGQQYSLLGNTWHDNPGSGGSKGLGGYLFYANGGSFSSVGFPPGGLVVRGDKYVNNGTVTAGPAILLSSSAIANGDVISKIDIDALFHNNTNTGVESDSSLHIANVRIRGTFSGANQPTALGPNITAVLDTAATNVTRVDSGGTHIVGAHYILGGHLIARGNPSPTIFSGAGTGATIATASGDLAGAITLGTGPAATVILNFGASFINNPVCFARNATTGAILATSRSTTQLGMTGTFAASDVLEWIAIGYQ